MEGFYSPDTSYQMRSWKDAANSGRSSTSAELCAPMGNALEKSVFFFAWRASAGLVQFLEVS